jgi:hypothetical protein
MAVLSWFCTGSSIKSGGFNWFYVPDSPILHLFIEKRFVPVDHSSYKEGIHELICSCCWDFNALGV